MQKVVVSEAGASVYSASEFAADIRRYLRNEPVLAAPPSTSYRVRKFVARHKFGVAAAAMVTVVEDIGGD